jgi:hypothetical protein
MQIKKQWRKLCSSREDKTESGVCEGHRRKEKEAVLVAGCYQQWQARQEPQYSTVAT